MTESMTNENIECVPSLATPKPFPRPEPLQMMVHNLDLTPEKKLSVSRRVDSELSVPKLNSTAKIQLKIEKLRKKKVTIPRTTRSLDPTPALNQCVNILKVW